MTIRPVSCCGHKLLIELRVTVQKVAPVRWQQKLKEEWDSGRRPTQVTPVLREAASEGDDPQLVKI